MHTAYITHPACLKHHMGHLHPESPARLKAIERWHQWQPGTSLASWVFRIIQTTWLDEHRTRQRRQTDTDTEALADVVGEDGRQVLEARSDARAVRRLIATLPEEQKVVLMMVTYIPAISEFLPALFGL